MKVCVFVIKFIKKILWHKSGGEKKWNNVSMNVYLLNRGDEQQ